MLNARSDKNILEATMSQEKKQPLTSEEEAALRREIEKGAGDWTVTRIEVDGKPLPVRHR
ncbi:hypothetical protein GCM10023195_82580 [Actinoallomurus liliacearum]|uniref:Uncharacterized protein n=1 Tax=Actinoallomurus liliacearum TaxID=1080073 RepID=A0ABP8TWP9_9ACTN